MIPGEALLDAYVNANILIGVAYLLWTIVREGMKRLGVKQAYGVQLKLLNSVFVMILAAPFLVLGFKTLQSSGLVSNVNVNLSDMVVSYYLNGGFEMKASTLEGVVRLRDTFLRDVLNASGWIAQGVILAFAAGVIVGGVRLIYSVACLYRIVGHSYAWRSIGRVRIRLSDRTLVPFSTRGLRNYYVVLPSHMLGEPHQMQVSLAHELQHIRQGDLEWEIVLESLKPMFFLNPFYHAWKRQVEDLREFNCDGQVLSKGLIDVRTYCDTLLSVCQNTLRRDRAFVIAVPKVTLVTADRSAKNDGRLSMLEHRILSVLEQQPQRQQRLLFCAIVLPVFAALFLATLAIQRPDDWSQDRLMLSTVVNLERLDEINRLSAFGRIRN